MWTVPALPRVPSGSAAGRGDHRRAGRADPDRLPAASRVPDPLWTRWFELNAGRGLLAAEDNTVVALDVVVDRHDRARCRCGGKPSSSSAVNAHAVVVGSAPPDRSGAASALSETATEHGAALSVAEQLPAESADSLAALARHAFIDGLGADTITRAVSLLPPRSCARSCCTAARAGARFRPLPRAARSSAPPRPRPPAEGAEPS